MGKIEKEPGAADAKWAGQLEGLKMYLSYQDAVGLDGEAVELEWTIFAGFTTLTTLKEIQMDMERKNSEPENFFKDRIIFMSMFSGIEWKKNDENCISNAEKVKDYSKRFLPGHWTFLVQVRNKNGTVAHMMDKGTVQPTKMVLQFKELGHPISPVL